MRNAIRSPRRIGRAPLALVALLAGAGAAVAVIALETPREVVRGVAGETAGESSASEPRPSSPLPERAARVEVGAAAASAGGGEPADAKRPSRARELLQREREQPGFLQARAAELLVPGGPRAEQVALLSALHEADASLAVPWFEHAIASLPDDSTAHGESTPCFALGFLRERAECDEAALASLARIAADRERTPAALRARAVARVAQLAPPAELRALRTSLRSERDPAVLECALAALEARRGESEALGILLEHGRDVAALAPVH